MRTKIFAPLMVLVVLLAACAPAAVPTSEPQPNPVATPTEVPMAMDIVEIAIADGRFSTLVAAVSAAGLVETLQSEGPFTVFAPTDEAFAQLPEGTVEALLQTENSQLLTDILLYHVVAGKVMAADVVGLDGQSVDTALEGEQIAVEVRGGSVILNGEVKVIITDIEASNGVIHVIDAVMLPPADEEMAMDIVETAMVDGRFTTLVTAVSEAGLVDTLKSEGPFTVFAPTDEAFAKLPEGTLEALLLPENKQQLTDILLYHVVAGKVMAADVVGLDGQLVETVLEGKQIAVEVKMGNVVLNGDVKVIITDVEASNGVIHVIDAVLLPPADEADAKDIVDIAIADDRVSTLVTAVIEAELVETLKSEGPFTLFAPTDEAFAKLPEGTLESLLQPENKQQLIDILLYHVVAGKVMAADVVGLDGQMVDTALEGKQLLVEVRDGSVFLNGEVMVIITDVAASNGVIHVIDAVLLPLD
jgi:transforming growth factor-beta-induced protein